MDNGEIMCYEKFCKLYNFQPPFTLYYGLISIIKSLDLHYDIEYIVSHSPFYPPFLQVVKKSPKGSKDFYYTLINNSWKKPICEKKWEKEFNIEESKYWWKTQNNIIFKATNDMQIRWFQYRIMHRILATNTFLCKIGIVESELCTFCNVHQETLSHLFWECPYVSEIWDRIHDWLEELSGIDIGLNKMICILGKHFKNNIFNLIFCIVKKHIYRKRCLKQIPSFEGIKKEIFYYYECERYIYRKNCEIEKFERRWNCVKFE
jgi:hypothetical protein